MAMEAGPRDRPYGEGEEGAGTALPVPSPAVGVEDGPADDDPGAGGGGPDDDPGAAAGQSFRELRPPRRLRVWQIAPIVALGILGSLMFAFPLAFEISEGGAVVAMLGLLLTCASAGWGAVAARRVGHALPGLPPRGSGRRADWRVIVAYTAVTAAVVLLAAWRVARLR
ncbi:hypothetical protein ODJ75_21910 [Streptomyces sp. HB2AG]|nr:hypothetical protein [Streptomyces sp. HB2AG]MCZ2527282.1 hypothetical protein [Streptomyces sp. HB2AG]